MGPLLRLRCLHCSAVDMLRRKVLKLWAVFGAAVVCCGEGRLNMGRDSVEKQNQQRMMENKANASGLNKRKREIK